MKYLSFILLLLATVSAQALVAKQGYIVNLGMIDVEQRTLDTQRPVRDVELNVNGGQKHLGIKITPPNRGRYRMHTVSYLPVAPEVLGGSLKGQADTAATEGYASPKIFAEGVHVQSIILDPSDPPGLYRVDVFIDGKLVRRLNFNVVKVDSAASR